MENCRFKNHLFNNFWILLVVYITSAGAYLCINRHSFQNTLDFFNLTFSCQMVVLFKAYYFYFISLNEALLDHMLDASYYSHYKMIAAFSYQSYFFFKFPPVNTRINFDPLVFSNCLSLLNKIFTVAFSDLDCYSLYLFQIWIYLVQHSYNHAE